MGRHYILKGQTLFDFNSGVSVRIFPVSTALLAEAQKLFPEPLAPIVETKNEDGVIFREENKADPDWKRAHDAWWQTSNKAFSEMMLKLGAVLDPADIDQARLQKVRDLMQKQFKIELDPDDNYTYLRYVLMADEEESQQLFDAIGARSKPEEGAVMRVLEMFPDQAQG